MQLSNNKNKSDYLTILIVICFLTIPFIGKSFHIDDYIYSYGAKQILTDPLKPLGGYQNLFGQVMPTYHFTQHPPIISYYIALVEIISGKLKESNLHLAFLFFSFLAFLAIYFFAARFCQHPLGIALLIISTPAFLVMAHNIMTEISFLAFYFTSVTAFIYGIDKRKLSFLLISSFSLIVTCFIQYRGLILLPILFLYSFLTQKNLWKFIYLLLPAPILFIIWSLLNYYDYGVIHFLDAWGWIEFKPERLLQNTISYLSFIGGGTIFPLFSIFIARKGFGRKFQVVAIAITTLVVVVFYLKDYPTSEQLLFVLFFVTGCFLFAYAIPSLNNPLIFLRPDNKIDNANVKQKEDLFLLTLLIIPFLSQIILNLFASVRSLLIIFPILIVMAFRKMELSNLYKPVGIKKLLIIGITLTLFSGIAVSIADWQYANCYRETAGIVKKYRQPHNRIFFSGEWGFRYYMEKNGYKYLLTNDNSAQLGDIVIIPSIPCPSPLHPDLLARLKIIDTIIYNSKFPIRVMNGEAHAGFYSDGWGLLPYSFSTVPLETFKIYQVEH